MGINDLMTKGKDSVSAFGERLQKQREEKKISLNVISGKKQVANSFGNSITMRRQVDGKIYFNNDDMTLYEFIDFSWDGPKYRNVTKSETIGKEKGKTKRKGRLIGAAVGTIVAPGIGTVIGAAHGTGNKKSKNKIRSNTVTYDEDVEIDSTAFIKLKKLDTNEIISLCVTCNNKIYNELLAFELNQDQTYKFEEETDENTDEEIYNTDPYEEVKKAKELLDMGIISQEEFDAKKKELLGL